MMILHPIQKFVSWCYFVVVYLPLSLASLAEVPVENRVGFYSSIWKHNGSIVGLIASGNDREFRYVTPRKGLAAIGIEAGTLLFRGKRNGTGYSGLLRTFRKNCPFVEFEVQGRMSKDQRKVVLKGQAPVRDDNCDVRTSRPAVEVFELLK